MNFAGMLGGFIAETRRDRHVVPPLLQPRVLADRLHRLRPGDDEDDGLRLHHRDDRRRISGSRRESGTEGVGRASTRAVVLSSMLIIVSNVVLVRLIFFIFPKAGGG